MNRILRTTTLALTIGALAVAAPLAQADPPQLEPSTFVVGPDGWQGQFVAGPIVGNANAEMLGGCAEGTVPGATGADNNNYDYYGDPCSAL
jgi:hypothetical protein